MRLLHHRAGPSAALVLLVGALVAGCGGTAQPVTLAVVGASVDGTELAQRVDIAVGEASTVRTTFDGAGFAASGVLVLGADQIQEQLTAKAQAQTVELVRSGGATYVRGLPPPAGWTPAQALATPWILVDAAAEADLGEQARGLLATLDLVWPRTLTSSLEGVPVQVLASDATSTTFAASVAPERLLGALAAASGVTEAVPLTVTVDARDRPLVTTANVSGQQLRISYSSWGEDLSVTTPAPATVGRVPR